MSNYRRSLGFYVLFCISAACLLGYYLRSSFEQEKAAVEARTANTSLLISEWIQGAFRQSDYVLRDIVSSVAPSELRYPSSDPAVHARRDRLIDAKRKTVPYAFLVALFDKNCVISHNPNAPDHVGFDAGGREYCKAFKANPSLETVVTDAYVSTTGRLNVTQARRLDGGDTKALEGFAAFAIDLQFFDQWLNRLPIGPHGIIAITDTRADLVARKPALPAAIGKQVADPAFAAFLRSGKRHINYQQVSPFDGEARLYSARRVDDLPFIVVVGEAERDWLAAWKLRLWGSVAIVSILWAMGFAALYHYRAVLRQKEKLEMLANTDTLTGIANRRYFISQAEKEINRAKRHGQALALLLVDIDRFKTINDAHGHAAGDNAILAFVGICKSNLRNIDFLARLGGDEFVILLPSTGKNEACQVAERIRRVTEQQELRDGEGRRIPLTLSIGLAMVSTDVPDLDAALAKADGALYQCKQGGRNRVVSMQ